MRLAARLRREIAEGTLSPGMPTPSITTLSQQYGHARQTCAKALRTLEDEGLLTRIPGLGYYVTGTADADLPRSQAPDPPAAALSRYRGLKTPSRAELSTVWSHRAGSRHRQYSLVRTCCEPAEVMSRRNTRQRCLRRIRDQGGDAFDVMGHREGVERAQVRK